MSAQTENVEKKPFFAKIKDGIGRIDGYGRAKAWLVATLAFVCALAFSLLPFLFRGTYTVWTGMSGDGATQFVTFFEHIQDKGWLKAIGDYDFYVGLGADYLTSFSFYSLFDPFNLILFGLPFGAMTNYTLTMAAKQLACALTMFAYLRYKKVQNFRAMAMSLAYMLSGFVAFTFVRHYNLAVGPIYLPLAVMGVDKLYKKERPYLFITALFLCLVSNFYVFFSLSVFVVAYAIAYYFHDCLLQGEKRSVKGFFAKLVPIGLYYILAVVLAGVVLLPNLYGYLHAARSGSKGLEFFNFTTFLSQAASLFVPMTGKNYSVVSVNVANAVLLLWAMCKRDKRTRLYRVFILVLAVGYVLPVFGYAMNIFNYSNNRWSYGLNFFAYVLIALQSANAEGAEAYEDGDVKKINVCFVVYVAILLASVLPAVFTAMQTWVWWTVLLSAAVAVGVGYGAYRLVRLVREKGVPKLFKKIYQPTVLLTLGVALTVGYSFAYYTVYSSQHDGKERYAALFSKEEQYIAEQSKDAYFRGDALATGVWYDNFATRGVNNGYFGTTLYNSIADNGVYEFLAENGVYNPAQNLGMGGLDGRYALQTLLSVKYTYDVLGQPYGFTKVDGYDYLYENANYLPFGFVTDKVYSREQYLALPVLERQYMLLDGVVLDGADDGAYTSDLETVKIEKDGAPITSFTKEKTTLTLDATGLQGKEVYLAVKGVRDVPKNNTLIEIACNGVQKEYNYVPVGNLMYSNQRDFYLQFGVVDESTDALEISAWISEGSKSVHFDEMTLYASPVASKQATMEKLSTAAHMEKVQLGDKGLTGEIQTAADGYLLLTLPYSEGWTAYVDGEEREILQADTAFMAIKLDGSGDTQRIELRYETPYLAAGKAVSFVGVGGLGCVLLGDTAVRLFRAKKKKQQGDREDV